MKGREDWTIAEGAMPTLVLVVVSGWGLLGPLGGCAMVPFEIQKAAWPPLLCYVTMGPRCRTALLQRIHDTASQWEHNTAHSGWYATKGSGIL